jgi:DNA-binding CsgD family transcriptional regulator
MVRYEPPLVAFDYNHLLDLAAALRELGGDLPGLARIPETLSHGLGVGPVSLALVHFDSANSPDILALHTFGDVSACPNFRTDPLVRADVLAMCQSPQAGTPEAEPSSLGPHSRCANGLECLFHRPTYCGQCRQTIVSRQVGATYRLIVMITHRPDETGLPLATLEALHLLMNHLGKTVQMTLVLRQYPAPLGEPFGRLTEREWAVLCDLDSEDGEKQIADRLGLSPHTLHSHIKNIYRKIGVQGRLPLLEKFRGAVREYRLQSLCRTASPQVERVAG